MTVLRGPEHTAADLTGSEGRRLKAAAVGLAWQGLLEWVWEVGVLLMLPTRNSGLRAVGSRAQEEACRADPDSTPPVAFLPTSGQTVRFWSEWESQS